MIDGNHQASPPNGMLLGLIRMLTGQFCAQLCIKLLEICHQRLGKRPSYYIKVYCWTCVQ